MADNNEEQEYEVSKPPTDLRKKVRELTAREARKFDPIKAAELALERLSSKFDGWMENETKTLLKAWETLKQSPPTSEAIDELFQTAHNIKGQAHTLGFPLVGNVAAELCYLLEHLPTPEDLPKSLCERYIEAIRAMVLEGAKDENDATGAELLKTLRSVTDNFIEKNSKTPL